MVKLNRAYIRICSFFIYFVFSFWTAKRWIKRNHFKHVGVHPSAEVSPGQLLSNDSECGRGTSWSERQVCASACKLTSSPGHGCLGEWSCARPRRCWAWGRLSVAGSAPTRHQARTEVHKQSTFLNKCREKGKRGWQVKQSSQTHKHNTTPYSLLSLFLQSYLKIVFWHSHRQEKPLFTVHW